MEKFVAILLFICSVCAAQETNWEKLKEENSPLTTSCIDLTKMNKKETRLSLVLFDNLKKYLSSNELTKDEKQKGIQLDLKAIGLQKKNIVIIFQKESALMAEPGNALRKENRMILEKKLEKWKASQKIKDENLVVRFDDECHVPDRCSDYAFDSSFLARLKRFGCK